MPDSGDEERSAGQKAFAVVGYMVCSSLMLLANKLAIHYLQTPLFVLFAQLAGTAVVVVLARLVGLIQKPIFTSWKTALAFAPAPIAFLGTIYSNIKVLQYANVETFIVFRSSTPVAISLLEYLYQGREMPTFRGWLCLGWMVAGAAAYTYTDAAFKVSGYSWVAVWYVVFVFDQIYVKHVVSSVKMESMWGRVYYSNLLAVPLLLCTGTLTAETTTLVENWSLNGGLALFVSCVAGLSMSYFSWSARAQLSASHFTVVGNICKIATVMLNVAVWDQHATPLGFAALSVTLGAAFYYAPAPFRAVEMKEAKLKRSTSPAKMRSRSPKRKEAKKTE
jgi:GDP-mannose transporter